MVAEFSSVRAMAAAEEARSLALQTATARLILDSLRKIESRIRRGPHPQSSALDRPAE